MKERITITVLAEKELHKFIDEFNKTGGIYENINSGLLQEPWIPNYLSILLDSSIVCIGGINYAGSDFINLSTNEKIEHKSAVIQRTTAELTNIGEIKRESDFISFFIRTTSMLYIVPTYVIMDLCELRLAGNTKKLSFKTSMKIDNKNNRLSKNTKILNDHIKSININTLEIYKI